MIVYLARDIPTFVTYCVYGESRSSLLIESTHSMSINLNSMQLVSRAKDCDTIMYKWRIIKYLSLQN